LIQFSPSTVRYDELSLFNEFLLILFEVSNASHDSIWFNIEVWKCVKQYKQLKYYHERVWNVKKIYRNLVKKIKFVHFYSWETKLV